ncbi:hypothetical protein PMAYCL1PPCAC_01090, partial [Pristionchus mayeri]
YRSGAALSLDRLFGGESSLCGPPQFALGLHQCVAHFDRHLTGLLIESGQCSNRLLLHYACLGLGVLEIRSHLGVVLLARGLGNGDGDSLSSSLKRFHRRSSALDILLECLQWLDLIRL